MILGHAFFNRHVSRLAQDLLGKELVFGDLRGIITETEAYRGIDDEASHAFGGNRGRAKLMFDEAGLIYVYMIYGMYYCMNIVAEEIGNPGAVLIRGLKLPDTHLNGPGKICRHLNINKEHNGLSIISNKSIYIQQGLSQETLSSLHYISTPRIGVTKAKEKLWRFVLKL
jgi:DNA-3-methyladenine glycosylase